MEINLRKSRVGLVVSDKMDKTITVAVVQKVKHPLYGKTVNKTKKFMAHDENNMAGIGDKVLIVETRPMSKNKHFRLAEIGFPASRDPEYHAVPICQLLPVGNAKIM